MSVALGNGTDDYPDGDKIGVVTEWKMPGIFEGASVDDLRKVQDKLAKGEWAQNVQSA